MISSVLHKSWLDEVVAGWDCAFEECYLARILLQDETFGAKNKILSFTFLVFSLGPFGNFPENYLNEGTNETTTTVILMSSVSSPLLNVLFLMMIFLGLLF